MKLTSRLMMVVTLLLSAASPVSAGPGADVINYECEQLRMAGEPARCMVVVFSDGSPARLLVAVIRNSGDSQERRERGDYLSKKIVINYQGYGGRHLIQRVEENGRALERHCQMGRKAGMVSCDAWRAPAADEIFDEHWLALGFSRP